jgi:anti-sigma regulatory factor (Ser/Thr protein kinase)
MMSSDLDLVTGIPAAGRQFRPGPALPPWRGGSPGTFLAGTGADQHCQQVAELLVSELVTNAVIHAPTTARLSVSVTGSTARIEVTDDGPGQPELRDPDPDHSGYGPWLVDWLAQS